MAFKIVAFGDSNTRYYLGDRGCPGPLEDAWPARLEALLRGRGLEIAVENQGWPGEQMDFAVAEFARITAGADLCVLGFGTNDVKKPEVPLEQYLAQLTAVLDQAEAARRPVVVLGIPWFSADLAGPDAQARIPVWNAALLALCHGRGLPLIDLYGAFADAPQQWFNEGVTPKRHLSAQAQARVAELVLPHALGLGTS